MFTVNRNPSPQELRKFGSAMWLGFGVIAALIWWRSWAKAEAPRGFLDWSGSGWQMASVLLFVLGAGLFAISRISPSLTKTINVTWMSLFVPVGVFMSTMLLSVVFFVFLPIFSLIVRLNDPLRKKLHAGATYWEDYRHYEPSFDRMRRLF
jgi:hypothetical protein